MKSIPLSNFIDSYNEIIPNIQDKYIKDNILLVNDYIDLQTKIEKISKIISNSFKKENQNASSIYRYVSFVIYLIESYTNLQVDIDLYKAYDLLKSNNLLDKILIMIPEAEICESQKFIDMILDDVIYFKKGERINGEN